MKAIRIETIKLKTGKNYLKKIDSEMKQKQKLLNFKRHQTLNRARETSFYNTFI
jgi:hypothetical protein